MTRSPIAAIGVQSWWYPAPNGHHGRWQLAATGVAFTASFSATANTSPGTFGIQINYTPVPPQPPTLPNSSLASLQTGAILMA